MNPSVVPTDPTNDKPSSVEELPRNGIPKHCEIFKIVTESENNIPCKCSFCVFNIQVRFGVEGEFLNEQTMNSGRDLTQLECCIETDKILSGYGDKLPYHKFDPMKPNETRSFDNGQIKKEKFDVELKRNQFANVVGAEFVSKILTLNKTDKDELRLVCEAKKCGNVHKACGLHVHVDTAGYSIEELKRIVAEYVFREPMIMDYMQESRSQNKNCREICRLFDMNELEVNLESVESVYDLHVLFGSETRCRQVTLNLQNLPRDDKDKTAYGTLEFRVHHATL